MGCFALFESQVDSKHVEFCSVWVMEIIRFQKIWDTVSGLSKLAFNLVMVTLEGCIWSLEFASGKLSAELTVTAT